MVQVRRFSRRHRWAAPLGALIVVAAVLTGTVLASAAPPSLPHRTPAQILAAMQRAKAPSAMSAVISESANLGFPSLPNIPNLPSTGLSSLSSLVSGTHTFDIWYAGQRHVRIAIPVSFGETDLRVNGNQVWLWSSHGQKATHVVLPSAGSVAQRAFSRAQGEPSPAPSASANPHYNALKLTPLAFAKRVLALAGPTTKVTVAGTTTVAGQPAYQLAIAPRSSQSLIGRILIAVDASNYLPLQVQVFARGATSPAFGVGFTSLSLSRPAMSNFTFTPPPGAHVKTVTIKPPAAVHAVKPGSGPGLSGAKTLGKGWLTVGVIPVGSALTAGQAGPAVNPGGPMRQATGSQIASLITMLNKVTTKVHGAWGSGRLLHTSLFSALLTSKGQLLIGAVRPAVLYADAAKAK